MHTLAWICALWGLMLGAVLALVPGFPGSAVGLLGLVAFAGLTGFEVLGPEALGFCAVLTLVGALAQLLGPVAASRASGGAAGASTGAALGAALGALVPIPGASWVGAVFGALLLGLFLGSEGLVRWLRGVVGTAVGCSVGVVVDGLVLLAQAGVLALSDFLASFGG